MVVGDLGFRAVFVLVFVAIGLFIRRKWRLAEARREEIRLLLAMASEEAARAEFEATIEYAASSTAAAAAVHAVPSTTPQRFCAVCYSPTTSRCRRCKSVRYWILPAQWFKLIIWSLEGRQISATLDQTLPLTSVVPPGNAILDSSKCQVIHWRQGHRHECSPSLATLDVNDEGSKLASKSADQNHYGDESTSKSAEDESEYASDSSIVLAQNSPSKEDIRSNLVRDDKILVPENSSVFAPTAVSSSSAVHKVLGDNSGLKEGDLCNLDASKDVLQGTSNPVNSLDPFADTRNMGKTKSSPSASVVEMDYNVSQSSNGKRDSQCISTSASDSDENIVPEPLAASSGFWDGHLEPSIINKSAQTGSSNTNYDGLVNGNAQKSRSFNRSAFSGDSSSDLHGGRQTSRPKKVTTLSGKEAINSLSSSNSVLLTSEQPISIDMRTNDDTNGRKFEEVKHLSSRASFDHTPTANAPKAFDSYDSGRSKHVNTSITESSQPSRSKMTEAPQYISRSRSLSDANRQSTSTLKPIQADNGHRNALNNQAPDILPNRVKVNQPRQTKLSKYNSFGVGSGPSAQNNEQGLFSYELFVKLYNWKEVELRPSGLINCGNRLTLAAKKGGAPLSPISILSRIEKIGSHLANGREEDAHEFMRYAIETMQSICLREAGVSGAKRLEEETTLLSLTFGGYLRSKIRCMRCRGKSEQHERMMDLTVEIEGNIDTLEEALRKFTGVEILDGENKYQCSRCKSYEKAKKRLTIYEAPNVLTIALKRFQAGKFGKLNKSIRFPDILDLAPYMRGSSEKSPVYGLYGVIVHLDVMNATFSGHYICYVRNAQNKWFKIDDSMVKPVEKDSVLKEGAYMLFYSRYSPRAPRSIRDSVVSRDILNKGKPPEFRSSKGIDGKKGGGQYPSQVAHSPKDTSREMGFSPRAHEVESSSESSSIFSRSEEGASTTDSNQESSTSTDDLLDRFFGDGQNNNNHHYGSYWRKPLDSDTSSSSSTSSSPLYMARPSPLSKTEKYASAQSSPMGDADGKVEKGDPMGAARPKLCITFSLLLT
ncbi:hypothetical protein V2J09_013875 [Rumex salicifolius]